MKTIVVLSCGLLLVGALLGPFAVGADGHAASQPAARPELEYLKAVNRQQPPRDPQLLFLLMAQFANANRHGEGAEFLSASLKEFDSRLSDRQTSLYLAAIGLLRAGNAGNVPFFTRIGWVRETIDILEKAKRLSGGSLFVVRWMYGVVSAHLPCIFHHKSTSFDDLNFFVANAKLSPFPELFNDFYYRLSTLYRQDG